MTGSPLRLTGLEMAGVRFRTTEEAEGEIRRACAAHAGLAAFHDLGRSEEGRPLYGVTLGRGPRLVTLVAGAHADEPVGPETLRTFVLEALAQRERLASGGGLLERFSFRVLPHVNPDAEARNRPWIERWPDLGAYLRHRRREPPGRDVEFGYPAMRPENRAAAGFLFDGAPIALHASLHSMGFAEGALLLVDRHWAEGPGAERLAALREGLEAAARAEGLRLHDHDRGGEKGIRYYGPGLWSTPEAEAMRGHFLARGDEATAAAFFLSSMEMARLAGYDAARRRHPLCLVTELPLFVVGKPYERRPGVAAAHLALQERLAGLRLRLGRGEEVDAEAELAAFEIRPLGLEAAVRLQLRCLELGLEAL